MRYKITFADSTSVTRTAPNLTQAVLWAEIEAEENGRRNVVVTAASLVGVDDYVPTNTPLVAP